MHPPMTIYKIILPAEKKLFENFNITSLEPTDLNSVKVSKKFVLTNKKMC